MKRRLPVLTGPSLSLYSTTIYVSSYYYVCVRILLYMCPVENEMKRRLPVLTGFLQVCLISMHSALLLYMCDACVCSRMLTYAHVCSRMLTYADVC